MSKLTPATGAAPKMQSAPSTSVRSAPESPATLPTDEAWQQAPKPLDGTPAPLPVMEGETVVEHLAESVAQGLPPDAAITAHVRARIVAKAEAFEATALRWARNQFAKNSEVQKLRNALPADFASTVDIELHGVSSHVVPETIQAHLKDRKGLVHVFVQGSDGTWVEHEGLTERVRKGLAPSMAPGFQTRERATQTFGIARLLPNGGVQFRVPNLTAFQHNPRQRPFQIGDQVKVVVRTGDSLVMELNKVYVPAEKVVFGKLRATSGRGLWTVEVMSRDGKPKLDASGTPTVLEVTDEELREANNPSMVQAGQVLEDMAIDMKHPATVAMLEEFESDPEIKKLLQERPSSQTSAAKRALWEQKVIEAADVFLEGKMKIPPDAPSIPNYDVTIQKLKTQLEEAQQGSGAKSSGKYVKSKISPLELQQRIDSLERIKQNAKKYYEYEKTVPNLGEYYKAGFGVCRHMCAALHAFLQHTGIDVRMTRGAELGPKGEFRGHHMWLEAQLADGKVWMLDPTWSQGKTRWVPLQENYEGVRDHIEIPVFSKYSFQRFGTD